MATSTASLSFSYVDAPEVLSLGATMSTVAIVVVATRFYLRRIQKSRVAADDWLILAALVSRPFSHIRWSYWLKSCDVC